MSASAPSSFGAPKRGRATFRLAVVAFMTAGLFAAGPELVHREQRHFAARLGRQALELSDGESLASVRRLALIGVPAIEPLVRLAACQRADVAKAAQGAIADQVAAWEVKLGEDNDQAAFAEAINALAIAIDQRYSEFGADGRRWAEGIARRLAAHVARLPGRGGWRAVSLYDRILSTEMSVSESRPAPAQGVSIFPDGEEAADAARPVESADAAAAPARPLAVAALPNAVEPISPPAEPPPATRNARPLPLPAAPQAELSGPAPIAQHPTEPREAEPKPAHSPVVDVPSPLDLRHSLQEFRQWSDRKLMTELETASRYEAAAMRKVLAGRGYSEEMLTLTRELEKLPALQRLEAIERAAMLPSSDARLLLRWFLADDDADVRLQALTTLATSGDPKMAEIARRCAVEDADPRVAELASELLKQR